MLEQNTSSFKVAQSIGVLLMVIGAGIIAKLLPEIYQLLVNPGQTALAVALMKNAGKDFIVYAAPNENAKMNVDIFLLPISIFLNIMVYALIAGIAKAFIYSGVRLFNFPVEDYFAKLSKRLDEALKK